jgi:hypothetical protein
MVTLTWRSSIMKSHMIRLRYKSYFGSIYESNCSVQMIPFIQLAQEASKDPIRLLASPWSPPAWMKLPQSIAVGSVPTSEPSTPSNVTPDPSQAATPTDEPTQALNPVPPMKRTGSEVTMSSTGTATPGPSEHTQIELVRSMLGSAEPNGLNSSDVIQAAWALYISYFIDAYADQGINIWAVTPQNEPEFAAPWEACKYTPEAEMYFINNHLGPRLEMTHPEVLIFAFDHNKDDLLMWAKAAVNSEQGKYVNDDASNRMDDDPSAGTHSLMSVSQTEQSGGHVSRQLQTPTKYIDGMAFHWYVGGWDRELDGTFGYNDVRAAQKLAPDMIMLATEGCNCPGVVVSILRRA